MSSFTFQFMGFYVILDLFVYEILVTVFDIQMGFKMTVEMYSNIEL